MIINGNYMSEPEVQAYINELERKLSETEDKHLNECRQISEYDLERKELKGLLIDTLSSLKNAFYANHNDQERGRRAYDRINKTLMARP